MSERSSEREHQGVPIPILWRVIVLILLAFGVGWWLGQPLADLLWYTGWQLGVWLSR